MIQQRFYLSLMLALATAFPTLEAFKINNRDIKEVAKPGDVITYEDPQANNIAFMFKDGHLMIGSAAIENMTEVVNFHNELVSKKDQLKCEASADKLVLKSAEGSNVHTEACLMGDNQIVLEAGTDLTIKNSLLTSKDILFVADKVCMSACFIHEAPFVHFESKSADALFRVIRFTFIPNTTVPCMLQGMMNLANGDMADNFIVSGACKIQLVLNDSVFA